MADIHTLPVMLFVMLVVSLQTPAGLNIQSQTPDIHSGNSTQQATGLKKSIDNRDGDNNGSTSRKSSQSTFNQMLRMVTQRYEDLLNILPSQAGNIDLPDLPDLSHISRAVPRNGFFGAFLPTHRKAILEVRDLMQASNNTPGILGMVMALRHSPDVNPQLWFYALTTTALKNPNLQIAHRISPLNAMPDVFIPESALKAARSHSNRRRKRDHGCVVLDERFGAENGAENILWYFRESIAVNTHHWYQHMLYPFASEVRENRRGELFYYMHGSLLARYNAERLSNGLSRVEPFLCEQGAMLDAYKANLGNDISGFSWTDRYQNTSFSDIHHENNNNFRVRVNIQDHIVTAYERIQRAIDSGFVRSPEGHLIPLKNTLGIDLLGDIVLASNFSLNPDYYGVNSASGLHGNGHIALSLGVDPSYRFQLPPGVMADPSTSMRDVIFYRWHAFIGELFDRHKRTLRPYTPIMGELPLLWSGVNITSVVVLPAQGNENQLKTYWSMHKFELGPGLDLVKKKSGKVSRICAKMLNHDTFTYLITVVGPGPRVFDYFDWLLLAVAAHLGDKDKNVLTNWAMVRIFLAPRFDERGNRYNMKTQRTQFFVLDSFSTKLTAGRNTIIRKSTESTLTTPWSQMYQKLNSTKRKTAPYCGCGWPRNMLLPKGKRSGMTFDLFVMLTNGDDDDVKQDVVPQSCRTAPIYCGIANQLYPDAKPMGYPFDRLPYSVNGQLVSDLDEYIYDMTNMKTIQVGITFTDEERPVTDLEEE